MNSICRPPERAGWSDADNIFLTALVALTVKWRCRKSRRLQGQQTTDYNEFRRRVSETDPEALRYLGIMIYGAKKKVSRVVGRYSLLRAQAQG
jgi:Protein of unknown function (DUF2000)